MAKSWDRVMFTTVEQPILIWQQFVNVWELRSPTAPVVYKQDTVINGKYHDLKSWCESLIIILLYLVANRSIEIFIKSWLLCSFCFIFIITST